MDFTFELFVPLRGINYKCRPLPRLAFRPYVELLPIQTPAARADFPERRQGPSRLRRRARQRLSLLVSWIPSSRCNPKLPLLRFHSVLRLSKQETGVDSSCWPFSCSFFAVSRGGSTQYTRIQTGFIDLRDLIDA